MAVDVNSLVSMNMWGLTPDFLTTLEDGFKKFFEKEVQGNPLKAEYLIPIFIGELLEQGKMSVKVVFCQVLFPEKSVGIPFFQQGIFPAFSGHYASLRMRACSIR